MQLNDTGCLDCHSVKGSGQHRLFAPNPCNNDWKKEWSKHSNYHLNPNQKPQANKELKFTYIKSCEMFFQGRSYEIGGTEKAELNFVDVQGKVTIVVGSL